MDFAREEQTLVAAIYDAALEPDRWPEVLRKIRDLVEANHCNLIFYDELNSARNKFLSAGWYADSVFRQYYDEMIHLDIRQGHIESSGRADGEIFNRGERHRAHGVDSRLKDFLIEDAGQGDQLGSRLFSSSYSHAYFSVDRPVGEGFFSESDSALLQWLSPHLCRAMRIHHQLQSAREEEKKLRQLLDRMSSGVLLLDGAGEVLFANREALRIVSEGCALRIDESGHLQATTVVENVDLQLLLAEALAAVTSGSALLRRFAMPLSQPLLEQPLQVSLIPRVSDNGWLPGRQHVALAVFIADPQRRWHLSDEYLYRAYGLTEAECGVSQQWLDTPDVQRLAQRRGTTVQTARSQLKQVMRKTDTHSQVDLVRLLMALNADFSTPVG